VGCSDSSSRADILRGTTPVGYLRAGVWGASGSSFQSTGVVVPLCQSVRNSAEPTASSRRPSWSGQPRRYWASLTKPAARNVRRIARLSCRALGPFRDLARQLGGPLAEAVATTDTAAVMGGERMGLARFARAGLSGVPGAAR